MILLRAAYPASGCDDADRVARDRDQPKHLVLIEVAVALLTLQAIAINRMAGLDYPWWARRAWSTAAAMNSAPSAHP
jgi:hypothetical protein